MRSWKKALTIAACLVLAACNGSDVSDVEVDTDGLIDAIPGILSGPEIATGDASIDGFLLAVVDADLPAVQASLSSVETISGRPLPFTDAEGYLRQVGDCDYVSGQVSDGMPGAVEVVWLCANGQFRQIIDANFAAPKITVTELF